MIRDLYRLVIRMHPPAFRCRFGDEMMSIFDEAAGRDTSALMLDGLTSFARQWLLRTGSWKPLIAIFGACIQLFAFCIAIEDRQQWVGTSQALKPGMQQVVLFASALTCTLAILIVLLILWNIHFQRRRSAAYKSWPRSVSNTRLRQGRR